MSCVKMVVCGSFLCTFASLLLIAFSLNRASKSLEPKLNNGLEVATLGSLIKLFRAEEGSLLFDEEPPGNVRGALWRSINSKNEFATIKVKFTVSTKLKFEVMKIESLPEYFKKAEVKSIEVVELLKE